MNGNASRREDAAQKKISEATENVGLFYGILKSMKKFNDQEIKGVISGQLRTTERENCFLLAYWRSTYNVDSMLELANVLHFQAIANLARTMLELAADARLLDRISNWANSVPSSGQGRLRWTKSKVLWAKANAWSTASPRAAVAAERIVTLNNLMITSFIAWYLWRADPLLCQV